MDDLRVGDAVDFEAAGTFHVRGHGKVERVEFVRDEDGRLVTVYVVSVPKEQAEPGVILLGNGEIIRRPAPLTYLH